MQQNAYCRNLKWILLLLRNGDKTAEESIPKFSHAMERK